MLDACLVNGFGVKTIDNLTVTDGIAVAHISSSHTFGEGDALRNVGVTGALAGLNDDWHVASVTADTVTWSVEGLGIPGGSASGTITHLRASPGSEKVLVDGRRDQDPRHVPRDLFAPDATQRAASASRNKQFPACFRAAGSPSFIALRSIST